MKKRKDQEDDDKSDDSFVTATRIKSKRLIRSGSLTLTNVFTISNSVEDIHEICMTSLSEIPKQIKNLSK